ncbi:MAG: hypothetical protein PQJ48_09180 [Sphaerochaetaceae bacterium]|nr:hypothetical protein [uncultured Sphaerochaeta sp.]MDC7230472.1 hypothetical protein [Sphaerochaetaceae bacterium]
MKKPIIYLLLALVIILGTGCNLFPYMDKTVYFYEMAGSYNNDSTYRLAHQSGGHTIIMSRGEAGKELTESQAEGYIDRTEFSLSLNETPLVAQGEKTVRELGDTGWHVVQSFTLPELAKGRYTLIGETEFIQYGNSRRNEVTLIITSFLAF